MAAVVDYVLVVDLQISDAGLVNFVLRPTYAGQKYAIFALNSLNLT